MEKIAMEIASIAKELASSTFVAGKNAPSFSFDKTMRALINKERVNQKKILRDVEMAILQNMGRRLPGWDIRVSLKPRSVEERRGQRYLPIDVNVEAYFPAIYEVADSEIRDMSGNW